MTSIESAASEVIRRIKETGATIETIHGATKVAVGTISGLLAAKSIDDVGITLKTLRRLERGLPALEGNRAARKDQGEAVHV